MVYWSRTFHGSHPLLANCLRLTVGTPDENDRDSSRRSPSILGRPPCVRPKSSATPRRPRSSSALDLDGTGERQLASGVPFLDHMLDQIARHGGSTSTVRAKGDLQIDAHHTVEDIGITLGMAVAKALGDKKGIRRYGHAYVPLDEALSRAVVDFSGRPGSSTT